MQDTKYFQAIESQMSSGGDAALLDMLMQRDISGRNIRTAPKTEALLSQKEESFTPVQEWWYQKLHEGTVLPGESDWQNELDKKRLFRDFQENTYNHRIPQNSLFRQLKKLIPGCRDVRKSNPLGGRSRQLYIPNLKECRAFFEKQVGQAIDWED